MAGLLLRPPPLLLRHPPLLLRPPPLLLRPPPLLLRHPPLLLRPPLLEKGLPKCPSAVRRSPCPPPAPSHQQKGQGGEAACWPS
ncbi:hypothetical protein CgunFtcFv8_007991 [Champsocephalus gunnari]|uniref:Uncharacterized protein n=1 Tax=Champsocephalus gunnari TaxID=52237 RepID=A0AAN8CZD8_CHAGU|nr:hypothetical protein CgunFtcFv8_007991 [Champsocephalus gunnari]